MYLCKNSNQVQNFGAITKFTPCGLPVWFDVEVLAKTQAEAEAIFSSFYRLKNVKVRPVESEGGLFLYNPN